MNKQELEWISVDDELPDSKQYVLAFKCVKGFNPVDVVVMQYTDKYGFEQTNISHWMPLPSQPTASEEV